MVARRLRVKPAMTIEQGESVTESCKGLNIAKGVNHVNVNATAKTVSAAEALEKIKPGMSIFLGTGVSEPRTLVKALMTSTATNLNDLELIQLLSMGDAVALAKDSGSKKIRLKTFFSGWVAHDAITSGSVDLIPCRFHHIPRLMRSGIIKVDVAFLQVSSPDENGFVSLGVSADVAKQAMEAASYRVGEINKSVPYTLGNTLLHVSEFDCFVESTEELFFLPRWHTNEAFEKLAANVASVIRDGSCLSFFNGSLYEALGKYLRDRKDLGVHTMIFTDVLMDLIKCGAVTNKKKQFFNSKSLTVYAQGTPELMKWLHRNPLVEFQGVELVSSSRNMGLNKNSVAILPVRKVDLTGAVALLPGSRNVIASAGQIEELSAGMHMSKGGKIIFALLSRNKKGEPNIILSADGMPDLFTNRESLDLVVTEYGIASMVGKTIRERAQALIDIAHPEDRKELVRLAKDANIIYRDQVFIAESGALYPYQLHHSHTLKSGKVVEFRAIKPSDTEEMRRLFYRFSNTAVYYRYFSPLKVMPHNRMQHYASVDYHNTISIVAVIELEGAEKIIAEGRYVIHKNISTSADVAFVVDENYQGNSLASILFDMLKKEAVRRGINTFTADVIAENKAMMNVFEKSKSPLKASLESGAYSLTMSLENTEE